MDGENSAQAFSKSSVYALLAAGLLTRPSFLLLRQVITNSGAYNNPDFLSYCLRIQKSEPMY